MRNKYIEHIDQQQKQKAVELHTAQCAATKQDFARTIDTIQIGDTVDVHFWLELGEKGRLQVFTGTVIAIKGEKPDERINVRRIVQGEGVERIFPLSSPRIAKIEVKRHGVARRAKLYYLRDRVGKKTRLKERKPK
ncbi:MAG: 50S ribosomal protein L19 [Zavarzinella sp.]